MLSEWLKCAVKSVKHRRRNSKSSPRRVPIGRFATRSKTNFFDLQFILEGSDASVYKYFYLTLTAVDSP